jgi:hypothetical protein
MRMADVEKRHASTWEARLAKANLSIPPFRMGWRTRILIWIAKRFGISVVLPTIIGIENSANRGYQKQTASAVIMAEEGSHARLLSQMVFSSSGGLSDSTVAQLEGRHRASGGNALRAAVLGANDGLVSILSLVMGVAGAALSNQTILITGTAGLLAGAGSMALGEWLSVQSSRELYRHQIEIVASIAFSTIGLFIIGAGITLFTGRSILFSGFRQVVFGLTAAGITYAIGLLIGGSVGG